MIFFHTDTRWVYVHLVAHIPVTLYFGHMFALVLPSLAAIQGRSGSIANPEYTMGGVCFLFGWLAFGLLAPVLCFVRKPLWWVGGLMLLWLVTIGVMFTPVGFPYREATSEQRFWVLVSIFFTYYTYSTYYLKHHLFYKIN